MKLLLLILLSFSAFAQTSVPAERRFALVEIFDNDSDIDSFKIKKLYTSVRTITDGSVTYQNAPGDSAVIYLSADPARSLKGTVTWKWADQQFDTTYVEKERYDDPSKAGSRWTVTNMFLAPNTSKPGVYNGSISYVNSTNTESKARTTFTGDMVEFFGERAQGHGDVHIYIDDQPVKTLQQGATPWMTDFSRMVPSFRWVFPKATPTSPAAQHTIELRTQPGNQYIIDMIRVQNYTLKPR
jgi:hypothetical protein